MNERKYTNTQVSYSVITNGDETDFCRLLATLILAGFRESLINPE